MRGTPSAETRAAWAARLRWLADAHDLTAESKMALRGSARAVERDGSRIDHLMSAVELIRINVSGEGGAGMTDEQIVAVINGAIDSALLPQED